MNQANSEAPKEHENTNKDPSQKEEEETKGVRHYKNTFKDPSKKKEAETKAFRCHKEEKRRKRKSLRRFNNNVLNCHCKCLCIPDPIAHVCVPQKSLPKWRNAQSSKAHATIQDFEWHHSVQQHGHSVQSHGQTA
jgi:hypothetical protein